MFSISLLFSFLFFSSGFSAIRKSVIEDEDGTKYDDNGETLLLVPVGKTSFTFNSDIIRTTDSISKSGAFIQCSETLETVNFDANSKLERLGNYTFESLKKLTTITLPSNLKYIGAHCFENCLLLETIVFNEGLKTIEDYAFLNDNSIKILNFPSTLETISLGAFAQIKGIENIIFPRSLTKIGGFSFSHCINIKSITFLEPSLIETIDENAFQYSANLVTFNIPSSLRTIKINNFLGCAKLTGFNVHSNSLFFSVDANKILFSYDKKQLISFPPALTFTAFSVPSSVEIINRTAFNNAINLASISIGENVVEIEEGAFSNTFSLRELTLPSSGKVLNFFTLDNSILINTKKNSIIHLPSRSPIKNVVVKANIARICDCAFQWHRTIETVTFDIGSKLTYIGIFAFDACVQLTTITGVPDCLEIIESNAFQGGKLSTLEFVNIKNAKVKYIGHYAFSHSKIVKFEIPKSVQKVGWQMFIGCSSLREVIIPSTLEVLNNTMFSQCYSLETVTFIDNEIDGISKLREIQNNCFESCHSIKKIVLPPSLSIIGGSAFLNCLNLTEVNFSPYLTQISGEAFKNCRSLETILIQGNTSIGARAFDGCSKLRNVSLSDSVEVVHNTAFYICENLEMFLTQNNPYYVSVDGVLFSVDKKTLVAYPPGNTSRSYIIPNKNDKEGETDTIEISFLAFYGSQKLEHLTIPDTITVIRYNAFENCDSLNRCGSVEYPARLKDAIILAKMNPIALIPCPTHTPVATATAAATLVLTAHFTYNILSRPGFMRIFYVAFNFLVLC